MKASHQGDRVVSWTSKDLFRFMKLKSPDETEEDDDADDDESESMKDLKNDLFGGDPEGTYESYAVFDADRSGRYHGLVGIDDETDETVIVDRARMCETMPRWKSLKTIPSVLAEPRVLEGLTLSSTLLKEMEADAKMKLCAHSDAVKDRLGKEYDNIVPPWIVLKARVDSPIKACLISEDQNSLPRRFDLVILRSEDPAFQAVPETTRKILRENFESMKTLGVSMLHICSILDVEIWFDTSHGRYYKRYLPDNVLLSGQFKHPA